MNLCVRHKVAVMLVGVMINHLMYVDDLVIISPSVKGLQRLLDICDVYGQNHDILFNHDKTVCMYMPSGNCYYLNTPVVVLNGIQLAFVRTYKYLATMMTCDNADDANMRRQRGICCSCQWHYKEFFHVLSCGESHPV